VLFANGSSAEGEEHNRRATELARQSLGEARRSVKALRPEVLEQEDLWVALNGLIKRMTAERDFGVTSPSTANLTG